MEIYHWSLDPDNNRAEAGAGAGKRLQQLDTVAKVGKKVELWVSLSVCASHN